MDKYKILCVIVLGCMCLVSMPRKTAANVYHDKPITDEENVLGDLAGEQKERAQSLSVHREKRFLGDIIGGIVTSVVGIVVEGALCLFKIKKCGGTTVVVPDRSPPTVLCPIVNSVYYTPDGGDSMAIDWGGDAAVQASDSSGIKSKTQISPTAPSGSHFQKGYYHIRYTAEDNAGNIGYCDTQFSVKVTTCQFATSPRYGSVTCDSLPPRKDDHCNYVCNEGYRLEDSALSTQTCYGEDTEYGQLIPSGAVYCSAIQCPVSLVPSNVAFYGCTNNFDVGSTCQYACREGYMLEDESMNTIRTCEVDGSNPDQGSWSSSMITCIDASPPEFTSCPDSFTVYVGGDFTTAYIDYTLPTAIDNRGNPATVQMTSDGISPGQSVAIDRENYANNYHYIRYTATDDHGIESDIPCLFTIYVKDLVCPLLEYQPRLITTCTEPLVYGATCTFECDYGYPLVGLSQVHCDRLEGDPPTAYWNWGAWGNVTECGIVECPPLPAPQNGAMSCVPISSGEYCTISCQSGWDIPRTVSTTGEFVCDDAIGWVQGTDVPDCTSIQRGSSMNLPVEFYYEGECTNETVQEEIRQSVIERLNSSSFAARCDRHPECTFANVEVTCGASGRKKRQVNNLIIVRFTLYVVIIYSDDVSITELDTELNDQLYNMFDTISNEISAGNFDIPNFVVHHNSLADGGTSLDCGRGTIARYSTYTCAGCAIGTYYDDDSDDCIKCPIGSYQDLDFQFNCTQCQTGYSTKTTGTKSSSNCTKLCDAGFMSTDGFVPCVPCELNSYQTDIGQTSCTPCPNGGNTTTEGSTTLLNCRYQDEGDVCQNDTCNSHGLCVPEFSDYRCICVDGYTGVNCTIPPNPCVNNLCSEGSTCVRDGANYSCNCSERKAGDFCDLDIVDGGWGDQGDWSACTVTCGEGIRTRIRLCNNPTPQNGGLDCVGDNTTTEQCVIEECPVCPELARPYGVILQCADIGENARQCNLTCHDDKLLRGYYPLSLTCGPDTGYVWNPNIPTDGLPKCVSSNEAERVEMSANYSLQVDSTISSVDAPALKAPAEAMLQTCVNSVACNSDVTVDFQTRKKRSVSTTSVGRNRRTVTQTVTIVITTYTENGTADNVNDLETIAQALYNASINGGFDVNINGVDYTVDPSSFSVSGSMTCPAGMTPFEGVCANCPPGTYADIYGCQLCGVGYYQHEEGQTSCISCPSEHTTSDVGSNSLDDCLSTATTTDSGITSSTTTATLSPSGNMSMIGIAVGVLAVVLVAVIGTVIGVIIYFCINKGPKRSLSKASITPWSEFMNSRPNTPQANPYTEKVPLHDAIQVAPIDTVMPTLPRKTLPPIHDMSTLPQYS